MKQGEYMDFAENLKIFRKAFKLSQEKFAKLVGISRGQVANYETDASEPNLTTIQKIADFFHVPIESMLEKKTAFLEKPVGKFFVKSNIFKQYDFYEFKGFDSIYEFNYKFGAFKDGDNRIIEFIYIGSCRQQIIDYMLSKSYSYEAFNELVKILDAQLGWKFVDEANTNTYIVVTNPDTPDKYYHIYGNYMSGMKMGDIFDKKFLWAINTTLTLNEEELKVALNKLYSK
jgi:transcriptional regulator, XRE family